MLQACDYFGLPFRPLGTSLLEKRAEIFLSAENYRGITNYESLTHKARFMGNANYYLARLLIFRGMRDDLPPQKIASTDPEYANYKCIGGNIMTLRDYLSALVVDKIIIGAERVSQVENFLTWRPDYTRSITRAEIEMINQMLDLAISWLSPLTNSTEVQRYFELISRHRLSTSADKK